MSFKAPEQYRLKEYSDERDGNNGAFMIPGRSSTGRDAIRIIASDGAGWEHVSVSKLYECPTWEEMCVVKRLFWGPEDCVVQFHPPESEYVNNHSYCLHMWRQIGKSVELPPSILVGIKG